MATEKIEFSFEELNFLLRAVCDTKAFADGASPAVDLVYKKILAATARLMPVQGE